MSRWGWRWLRRRRKSLLAVYLATPHGKPSTSAHEHCGTPACCGKCLLD